jgi:hypothetical protein
MKSHSITFIRLGEKMEQIQHIKEEQMYSKVEDFLKQQGYQIPGIRKISNRGYRAEIF